MSNNENRSKLPFFKRLKTLTPEMEEEFSRGMDEVKPTFKEKLLMVLTAYLVLLVPSVLVLLGLCLTAAWLFGFL